VAGRDVVLQQHRDAVQRAARPLRAPLVVERGRDRDRVRVDLDHRAQLRPAAVDRLDAQQVVLRDLAPARAAGGHPRAAAGAARGQRRRSGAAAAASAGAAAMAPAAAGVATKVRRFMTADSERWAQALDRAYGGGEARFGVETTWSMSQAASAWSGSK